MSIDVSIFNVNRLVVTEVSRPSEFVAKTIKESINSIAGRMPSVELIVRILFTSIFFSLPVVALTIDNKILLRKIRASFQINIGMPVNKKPYSEPPNSILLYI